MAQKGVSVGVEITGTAKGFKAASEDAAKATEKLKSKAEKDSGGISNAFRTMGGAVGNAVRTMSAAFKALLANPIVLFFTLIVGAVMGLVNIFKSSDSGATKFAARFEQIKAILDVVRQRLLSVTDAIGHVFKGEFKQAAASMKEAFSGIGDQIKEATKAAYDYQYALDAIADAENNYISQSAENKNRIAKLEFTAQDRSKSTAERKAALKEAIAISEEEARKAQEFAKMKLDAEVNYLAGKAGLRAEDVLGYIRMTDAEQQNANESLKTLRNNNEAKFEEIEKLYASWLDADTKFYEENKRNISKVSAFEQEEIKNRADALKELKELYQDVARVAVKIPVFSDTGKKPIRGGGLARGGKDLASGPTPISPIIEQLSVAESLINNLDAAFAGFFQNTGNGFKSMAKAFTGAIQQMAAQIAAKAALFTLIKFLFPVGSIAVGGIRSFIGLAEGGIATGPTLANVGEYAGAKSNPEVIAPLSKLKSLLGNTGPSGEVVFKIEGDTLVGVLSKRNRKSNSFR